MPVTEQYKVRRRKLTYMVSIAAVAAGYFLLRSLSWQVSLNFLLATEWISTGLSICIGAFALVRFYSRKEITFLFIGAGFLLNGLLASVHAIHTFSYMASDISSQHLEHVAWSHYASRLFLPVLIWISWYFEHREQQRGKRGIGEISVYWIVGFMAVAVYALFDFISSSPQSPSEGMIADYWEYLPAIFLGLALVGYFRTGKWKFDRFFHWLIIGIILSFSGEVLQFPIFSSNDVSVFALSNMLNASLYDCVFIGLLLNMHRLYSESLAHQELKLKNIILSTQQETSLDAILVVDENAMIISYNRRFVELWNIPEKLVRARVDQPVLETVVAQVQDPEDFLARVKYLYEHKSEQSYEELLLKDGRIIDRYSAPMIAVDGKYYGRIWYFRDVTEKKTKERELSESESKFRGLVDQSLVGIALVEEGKFTYANQKLADILGYNINEILKLEPTEIAVGADKPVIAGILQGHFDDHQAEPEFLFQGRRKDQSLVNIEGRCARLMIHNKPGLLLIFMDITERVQAQQVVQKLQVQLIEQAIRDPLTGLYNRRYLDECVSRELARAERNGYPLTVVMGDIDHFKTINDTYGHLAGDEVLRVFANLLKDHSRRGDIVCRYGGEEFVMLMPEMDQHSAFQRAEELRQAFYNIRVSYNGSVIQATASFGVSTYSGQGQNGERLLADADKALYASKNDGRNKVSAFAA